MLQRQLSRKLRLTIPPALLLLVSLAQAQDNNARFPQAFKHEATRVQSVEPNASRVEVAPAENAAPAVVEEEWSPDNQGLADVLPKALQREVFEEVLRVNFYGTYVFYSRLGDEDQRQVYSTYTQAGTIDSVREDVMRRSRLRHKLK